MNLLTQLQDVKGVGPKTADDLMLAGLRTVGDLITFLPRSYEDFSVVTAITDISPGKRTIRARCEKVTTRRVRRGLQVTTATLYDKTGKLQAVWFNQAYRAKQLSGDDEFFFSGEFEFSYNRYQLSNPSAEKVSDMPVSTDRIVPIYRSIKGLKSQLVRKLLVELKPFITMLPETLPKDMVAREKLQSYSDALLGLHFPKTGKDVEAAKERLGFEELLQLLIGAQLNKQSNAQLEGWKIPFDQSVVRLTAC